ncbi:glycosyltransferase [Vulcaniibacterium gelatinicum]|uniref:glycosyltransferase n=1 Tax=Vulcaniibacterium gelatinicum TaxID=2598725 RepID=UPI0011CAC040|nr:glycosyltransferase [Vulcaniibacterium gelatinicum]
MRIVHLLLTRRFAGSERYAVELANAQAAAGHEVTLILRRAGAQPRPDAIAHRVDPRVRVEVVSDLLARWQARRRVRRLRPDVAHAHLSGGCRALHGLDGVCLRVATLHIAYKPQQHARLDALVAIAPWQLAAIPERLRAHTVQMDNWTLPVAPAADARARLRAAHGIPADAYVLGALGRAERNKGFDLLLEAFHRLDAPDVWLVVAGQGRELEALRARAAGHPRIVLPGFVERPQDWLAAYDAFVSAARDEPFGLVLLEAMQAGLPIVATASQGARHLADAIGTPLVPLGDVEALARALHTLAAARPPRRAYPMQRFSLEARLAELEAFYRRELAALGRG